MQALKFILLIFKIHEWLKFTNRAYGVLGFWGFGVLGGGGVCAF